ncbi:putative protein N(5)-glutamine methyltransferase [Isoptericola sp. b515]|uniref:putative protein N(5)-glutamine methyltransferase n=1 Tax=Isoptericola sp. b515 TaxID=3064652 RepID=UPI002712E0C7|nr:putative protein N(5)-glutamine methyltransferase [Isoptericola sp. b515]MDO8149495.1 putative protein N(5)-glutamine methyltransferase [Isoptericola sp. b515]
MRPAGDPTAALADRLRDAGCVFAEDEAAVLLRAAPAGSARLEQLVARRTAGEPLEHVLGEVELAGRTWTVGPGVFVPRRRSEALVEAALDRRPGSVDPTVVDLCCGCGALGGAVLEGLTAAGARPALHAVDVDPVAVGYARRNLEPLGAAVATGDLFEPLPRSLRGRVDLLLCHAPYVPTAALATMPPEARDHEPPTALDGGADGLDVLRRVLGQAPRWLAPRGVLLFEIAARQWPAARGTVVAAGLRAERVWDEDRDATVVVARRERGDDGPG